MSDMALLKMADLCVSHCSQGMGHEFRALDGASLSVVAAEIVGGEDRRIIERCHSQKTVTMTLVLNDPGTEASRRSALWANKMESC